MISGQIKQGFILARLIRKVQGHTGLCAPLYTAQTFTGNYAGVNYIKVVANYLSASKLNMRFFNLSKSIAFERTVSLIWLYSYSSLVTLMLDLISPITPLAV
jgi:hypothetical protein